MKFVVVLEVDPEKISLYEGENLSDGIQRECFGLADGVVDSTVIEPDHKCFKYIEDPDPVNVAMNAQMIGSYITSIIKKE